MCAQWFTLRYVQCIVIDKGIKQQRLRLRIYIEAKSGHINSNFKHKFRMIVAMTYLNFEKICQVLTILH